MMEQLQDTAQQLGELLKARQWFLSTAESCTGGRIASMITSIAGSSAWFDRGFVTYSNSAKHEMLGVQTHTLNQFGAVSQETVKEMAEGAIRYSHAQLSIAVTGIAGPSGGCSEKPVGLVWFGLSNIEYDIQTSQKFFDGSREDIQFAATFYAINYLIDYIKKKL